MRRMKKGKEEKKKTNNKIEQKNNLNQEKRRGKKKNASIKQRRARKHFCSYMIKHETRITDGGSGIISLRVEGGARDREFRVDLNFNSVLQLVGPKKTLGGQIKMV